MKAALGISLGLHAAVLCAVTLLPGQGGAIRSESAGTSVITLIALPDDEVVMENLEPQTTTAQPEQNTATSPVAEESIEESVAEISTPLPVATNVVAAVAAPEIVPQATSEVAAAKPEIIPEAATPTQPIDVVPKPSAVVVEMRAPKMGGGERVELPIQILPKYVHQIRPEYPLSARRKRQEGLVLLRVILDEHGIPGTVEIKTSSGVSVLDKAAVTAVLQWRFEPYRVGKEPQASEAEVPIRFEMER